ncbi:MAG: orotate phosphoribosyltransferase [candidate division Zixibacteria bacterium]|nr:orotate phosphoribosyltransferase [candidate division Zixibacteria bacterium]MBU1469548.1 orotate phosphoribosyltransferase [candidate division Zixibacteria bacterium]MBU2624030.1 orotate phosphoribosyltransferase [candidate division Zixibacteria bacterium]
MSNLLTMNPADAKNRLRELVNEKAVIRGDFILASGARSNYYVDAKFISLTSEGLAYFARVIVDIMDDLNVDLIGGMTLGADPIIGAVVAMSHLVGKPVDGIIVRKEAKGHGRGKQIEGPISEGAKVLIIEDVVTTGGSSLKAIDAVEKAGGKIAKVICLVDRLAGGRESFESKGYKFESIFTINDLDIPKQ